MPTSSDDHLDRRILLGAAGLAGIAALASTRAAAGPLSPPAGAVASTAKPLGEIEPRTAVNATNTPGDATCIFRISQPGSYYLTGNITGVVGKHGIRIASDGVTLDLNGFELRGVSGLGSFDGVNTLGSNLSGLTVVNGSVRSWGRHGVNLASVAALGCLVERVIALSNVSSGVSVYSATAVRGCTARSNAGTGFSASEGCIFEACVAIGNTLEGFNVGSGCTVINCTASANLSTGISAGAGSVITACAALNNRGSGVFGFNNITVHGCNAQGNFFDGVRVQQACVVDGCTCGGNGNAAGGAGAGDGAGVHATGSDNRLTGNTCTGNDRGIDVDANGNFIARNTCRANTVNWDISINNAVAPIINCTTNAAPIAGNSYTGTLGTGSTDPNANFTY